MTANVGNFDVTEAFVKAGGPTFLRINLDAILNNVKVVKSFIGANTGKYFIFCKMSSFGK